MMKDREQYKTKASWPIKWALLALLYLALAYPLVQWVTPLENTITLKRMKLTNKTEAFNQVSWFSGVFQESVQAFVNDNIGLFPFFIKLHNQLDFVLFNEIHTGSVIEGENKYLFESSYGDAIQGLDRVPIDSIQIRVQRLKALQDQCAAKGKYVLVCLAASKNRYYPEYLPWLTEADTTNRSLYLDAFDQHNINYFNTDRYFASLKDSLGYLVFPQYGVHWSHYSTMLMADTLTRLIAQETEWQLPKLKITAAEFDVKTRYYDNDIAEAMNLFVDLEPDQPMLYPTFEWVKPADTCDSKNILFVGDSFSWDFYENSRMGHECFADAAMFYYNLMYRSVEQDNVKNRRYQPLVRHVDFQKIIAETDVILIVVSESNLSDMGWSFMLDYQRLMENPAYRAGNRKDKNIIGKIRTNKSWYNSLVREAEKRNITTDSFISLYLQPSFNPFESAESNN